MTLEQRLSDREKELKELKRVVAREFQNLHNWADSHLAVKDVHFN
jgi:flagellar biosynthesis/type III secretory pathway chaperone